MLVPYRTLAAQIVCAQFRATHLPSCGSRPSACLWQHLRPRGRRLIASGRAPARLDAAIGTCNCKAAINELTRAR